MPGAPLLPSPTAEELKQLLLLARDARTTSYFAVAALTLLVFDYSLSLGHEIEFVWKRPKSYARYIYLWNRYFALIITGINTSVILREVKTDKACQIYTQFEGVTSTLVVLTVDIILLLRVWIISPKSPRLMHLLIPLVIVEIGVMFFIAAFTIKKADTYVHVGPQLPGCYSLNVPRFFVLYPIPSLLVTSTMFALTLYNCKKRLSAGVSPPLISLFLRDGVYWFLAVVAVNPPQIFIWAFASPTLTELLIIPSIAVYSIIGSRVLLNIMEIMSLPESDDQTTGTAV